MVLFLLALLPYIQRGGGRYPLSVQRHARTFLPPSLLTHFGSFGVYGGQAQFLIMCETKGPALRSLFVSVSEQKAKEGDYLERAG